MPTHVSAYRYWWNKKKYKFDGNCILVDGAKRSALYHLTSGRVYSINQSARNIICKKVTGDSFIQTLIKQKLLVPADTPVTKEPNSPVLNTLKFAWLEITEQCQNLCIHCYGLFGNRPKPVKKTTHQVNWRQVLTDVYGLGARSIQFIGGEPLLYVGPHNERLLDLIRCAKNIGFTDIEVFTNGIAFTGDIAKEFKKLNVAVAMSFYSADPLVHERITQRKGSFDMTMKAITLCQKEHIQLRLGFVAMKQNEQTIEETIAFLQKHKLAKHPKPDIIRPMIGGVPAELQPSVDCQQKYGLMTHADFYANTKQFTNNRRFNPCLGRIIAITSTGDVLPCVFARQQVFGNVTKQNLRDIVKSKQLQAVWNATKDSVSVCKDCEYRYACHDCRPLNSSINKGNFLTAPPARCTYNPYTGEWGKGMWRMNAGQTCYTNGENS